MKLYYSPGACSLSCHIALCEAGITHDAEAVTLATHKTAAGEDYYGINPKGSVPALVLEQGVVLTENAAILQYIGDHFAPSLLPANGTLERTRLQEMLSFIGSDYHKLYSPLFRPDASEDWKTASRAGLAKRQAWLEGLFADGRLYLLGQDFTVADAYLFTVTRWGSHVGVPIDSYLALTAYMERMAARPGVQAALEAEALAH